MVASNWLAACTTSLLVRKCKPAGLVIVTVADTLSIVNDLFHSPPECYTVFVAKAQNQPQRRKVRKE
jgi:hypothetical protein